MHKEGDDLMSATRYAVIMLRHARTAAALQSLFSSARISKIGDCVGIKIGPSLAKAKNVNISFLNLDLDAFLDNVAHSIAGDERRDPDHCKPWREAEVRAFLENQCHLKTSRRVPGRFFVHHDQAFDFWRESCPDTEHARMSQCLRRLVLAARGLHL